MEVPSDAPYSKEDWPQPEKNKAAMITRMDADIGRIMAQLKALRIESNTVVFFSSDNGPHKEGGVKPDFHHSSGPLRGIKRDVYEGGIRVPMIVRWPGVVTPGSASNVPVLNVDFYPTFLAAAGAAAPASPLDGESLLPMFQGKTELQRKAIFWHFPGYLDGPVPRGRDPVFRTRPVSIIRKGDWKLHLFHEEWQLDGGREKLGTNRAVELYNLASDPGETTDLAATNMCERDELLDDLVAWIKRVPAPLPEKPNPDYDPKASAKGSKKKAKSANG
jgi:arylsulfatase A-like enzyme